MTREKKLGSGLYFSAEELFPALLLLSCAFLKTLAVTATDAGASVLFLTESSGQNIPQILIATAVLLFIIWPVLSALKEKSPLIPSLILFAAAGVSFLLYGVASFIPEPILAPVAMVWKEGFRILAEAAFWLTAFRFGVFNGKTRLLLVLLIAQTVGMLGTSGLILLTTEHPETLILYAAVLSAGTAFLLKILIDNGSAPIQLRFVSDKKKTGKTGNDSLQKNLSLSFFISSGILFFAAGIFQYYFLISAAEFSAGQEDILSRIYSTVLAGTAVVTTGAFYVFFKSRLSLFAGLFLLPVVLLAAAIGGWFALFGIIVAAQIVFGLANSAKEAVLQTIPLAVSLRTGFKQTLFRKSVIEPVALAVSGIFLLIIEQSATEFEFLYFTGGLAVIVLMVIVAVRQAYLAQILNMLKKHLWRGGKLLPAGKEINRHLQDCLNSRETENVLYALRIIEESITPRFLHYLMSALHHDNEDVRLYALSKIEDLKLSSAVPEILRLLEKDDSVAVRQNAVRVICRLGGAEEREKAVTLVQDPLLKEGALTGLLAVGREGVFVAIKCVADLSVSPDKNDRLLAAAVLGNAGNPAFYQPLQSLLADPDSDVCKAALKAAGKLVNPLLLPAITETFRYSELREEACAALLQYRETAFNEIDRILDSQKYPVQFRILLTRLVAHIASPEAENFLFKHIQINDRRVRFKIIKALALSGYKASGKAVNIVRLCLYDEMETATGILAALHAFNKNKDEELDPSLNILKSALNREIEYIKERVLLLLALLFPSKELIEFLNTYNPIVPENEKTIKITDKLLSGELKTLCMPLFEDKPLQQKLALLRPQFFPPVLPINGHIQDILETPVGEMADWTRACAAYTAGYAKDIAFVNALTALLPDADAIVRETAVWALGKILPREEVARLIAGNLEDSSVYVARMARFVTDGSGQIVF
ncbi:MAG: HEAT repeat domain-containing protein [Alphaproteobacteria bacterium]|nr:HEAT repeat domain-containing protein [Alphaproteobacteria bacterium]MBO4643717.1 HEAT repeat domain-containing protein [Alphaproteobacteria bacterium]